MNSKKTYLAAILSLLIVLSSCSTEKNTPMSRRYHAMLTRYNIAFNGNNSFREGIESIDKANTDIYSQPIYISPVSNHTAAESSKSNMDRSIEKNRKAIKMHSIKKKPKRNSRHYTDPKQRAFYNQNEFNPELKKAWIQLGKSEFFKGDFLNSVGTFAYIIRHYAAEPQVVSEAQIWMARAYIEQDWLYEAEEVIEKIKSDQIPKSAQAVYDAARAQLLIKQHEYEKAIPFLKAAAKAEKDKKQRTRYNYLLAQLLERTGQKEEAVAYYTRVHKASPPYEMEFNARINKLQLTAQSSDVAARDLRRMARNKNNEEYQDQIFTVLGNLKLNEKDTVEAIKNYNLAIEKSTRNSFDKAVTLVTLGNIYYSQREYVKAHPCYDEASNIYTPDYEDYELISHRSETLAGLVKEFEMVHLQDSLQALADMPEKERLEAINRVIEKIKKEEKEAKDQESLANRRAQEEDFRMPIQQIGGSGDWYFYNAMTVSNGKNDFRRRWGTRKLEDNWRRSNKSAALFDEESADIGDVVEEARVGDDKEMVGTADEDANQPKLEQTNDRTNVNYYLAQIPFTAAQKEQSDIQLAEGLYNLAFVYKDKIEDYPLAYETFARFEERFNADERIPETLFQRFLLASKENRNDFAESFRQKLLSDYPDSRQAEILADANYISNQKRMFEVQGELYADAYKAFAQSEYDTVFENTKEIKTKYPQSTLLPQFEFLNTLSIGKTAGAEEFEESLNALVENYPESNIGSMSKDILALLKQGNIAQQGSSFGTLLARRDSVNMSVDEQMAMSFSELKFTPHRMLFVTEAGDEELNKLQYNLAIFNFSRFMIKDFGFAMTRIDGPKRALSVLNLASYNEAIWYRNTLGTDKELSEILQQYDVQMVIISEENFGKLHGHFTLEEYLAFEEETLAQDIPEALLAADEQAPKQQKRQTYVEIIDGTGLDEKKEEAAETEPVALTEEDLTEKTVEPAKQTEEKEVISEEEQTIAESRSEDAKVQKTIITTSEEKPQGEDLFKNLYAYTPAAAHYVLFYIPRGGKFDFNLVKKALDDYNSSNYAALNLSVTLEEFGRENMIVVSSFTELDPAKSYFLRMLKDPAIIKATSGMNKRNLIITRENLNTMLHNDALSIYFEFMRERYLKP